MTKRKTVYSKEYNFYYDSEISYYPQGTQTYFATPYGSSTSTPRIDLNDTSFNFYSGDEFNIDSDGDINLTAGNDVFSNPANDFMVHYGGESNNKLYLLKSGTSYISCENSIELKSNDVVWVQHCDGNDYLRVGQGSIKFKVDDYIEYDIPLIQHLSATEFQLQTTTLKVNGSIQIPDETSINAGSSSTLDLVIDSPIYFNCQQDFTVNTNSNSLYLKYSDTGKNIELNSSRILLDSKEDETRIESDMSASGTVLEVRATDGDDSADNYFVKVKLGAATLGGLMYGATGSDAFISDDGTSGAPDGATNFDSGNAKALETAGGLIFSSTDGDFAETFELGDYSEHKRMVSGVVVYLRNNKAWLDGYGQPMVVSKSPFLLGNNLNISNKDLVTRNLVFTGQTKIYVYGKTKSGDYIIPDGNKCYSVPKKEASFEDFKNSIGISIEDSENENLKLLNCVIGVK
tara:strand:- start:5 stop:1384 length:1380 start_codon:yes stop_codon:yes gene_type:complete